MTRYVQKGEAVDYRPTEAVAAGDVIVQGSLVGVARLDIEAGTLGSLAVVGVFDAPKAFGEIAVGTPLYWDAENKQASVTQSGKQYLGKSVAFAADNDEVVRVLLNAPYVAV
jgi:predicted RecA/RadA family phage recombinase